MANLYTGIIATNGEFQKLSQLSGITFINGTTYTIQIQNTANIREGITGEGFIILSPSPFQYTAGQDDLYIQTKNNSCVVNIAD